MMRWWFANEAAATIGTAAEAAHRATCLRHGACGGAPHDRRECPQGSACPRQLAPAARDEFGARWAPAIGLLVLLASAAITLPLLWAGLREVWTLLRMVAGTW